MRTLKEWVKENGDNWNIVGEGSTNSRTMNLYLEPASPYDNEIDEAQDVLARLNKLKNKEIKKNVPWWHS